MASHRYRLGGHAVSCDRALSGMVAPAARGTRVDIAITTARPRQSAPRCQGWFHAWREPAGAVSLQFGRVDSGYLIDAPRRGRFFIHASGRRIVGYPALSLGRAAYQHLLLDQVLPLALGLRGEVVLHASSVVEAGRAFVFSGPSGRGKSTLAAHFAAAGARLLADDCQVLRESGGRWRAFPFDQGIRLSQRSARATLRGGESAPVSEGSAKRRLLDHPALRFRRSAAPLGAIVLLQPRRRGLRMPKLVRLTPREAILALLPQMFFFEVRRQVALRRQFEQLTRLAAQVPVWRATLPADLRALGASGEALRALMR